MGCCLIHRSVFETFLTVPEYANDSWTWFGRDQYWEPDTLHMGEDVSFCQRAAKLGIQTWGVSSAICTHAKRMEIDFDLFRILYEANYKGRARMKPVEEVVACVIDYGTFLSVAEKLAGDLR